MNAKIVYAEEVNYWKTGQSSPDTWIDRAKGEIIATGGKVLSEAYGSEMAPVTTGRRNCRHPQTWRGKSKRSTAQATLQRWSLNWCKGFTNQYG